MPAVRRVRPCDDIVGYIWTLKVIFLRVHVVVVIRSLTGRSLSPRCGDQDAHCGQ